MGRSANPFMGFVHKCDRMQLLQCLHWQVVQSAGDVSDSAFIHTGPLCSPFWLCCSFMNSPTRTKAKECKASFCDVLFASFLSAECCAVGWQVGDFIVEKTKQNYGAEQLLMVTRYSSLLFITLLFWSSPLSLPSFTFSLVHCHFFSLSFHFWCSDVSSRFSSMADLKKRKAKGTEQSN